jgi:hypothetical protein
MSEEQNDSEFASRLKKEQPGSRFYAMLKAYGFEPDTTVYKICPFLSLENLKEARYGSTYTDPKTIRVKLSKEESLNVVVLAVSALFIKDEGGEFSETGYFPHPNWLIEGWVLSSDPTSQVVRVRICLEGFVGETTISEAWLQRVPKNSDPDGSICWVELPS